MKLHTTSQSVLGVFSKAIPQGKQPLDNVSSVAH